MMSAKLVIASLVPLVLLVLGAESLSCPPKCEPEKCPDIQHCQYGVTRSFCGCCNVCLQIGFSISQMSGKLLVASLVLLAIFVLGAESLTCPPKCNPEICPGVEHCLFGITKGVCGCCDVCLKGLGERCGGPWNISGKCAHGLYCGRKNEHSLYKAGTCVRDEALEAEK